MVFYNILLPMFSAGRSPASLLLVCVPPRTTANWLLLRSVVPYHSLFLLLLLRPSRQVRLLFLSTSLLSLGYPSPTPPSLFLTGSFDAQVSGFRYPSPAPPRLFLTGYFDAQVSLFRYPRAFFSLPVLVSLIVCFDALLFFPPNLSFPVTWVAGSLLVPPCGTPAVFTAPRFLPLRGFYRSAVFYRSAFAGFLGALLFRRPHACCPPSLHPLPGGSLFVPPCGSPAIFTAPRFLPLRGFLPLSGFYRSAVFTAPLSSVFWGLCSSAALMLAAPQSSPTSGRLALCAALRYACDFYRSAVFTAPLSPVFWGLCSSAALLLAAPQSSPSSGRTLWCRLVRSVSGGPPFLTLFLYRLLNRSRSVTAHLTGFPFVHFIHIKGPSIVSSFECRDTGTACTSTSLWNLTAHGNKAFSPQTDGSAVCRYAY